MTDGQDGGGAKAIPEFHHWADNRRQRSWHRRVPGPLLARGVLMAISSGCICAGADRGADAVANNNSEAWPRAGILFVGSKNAPLPT